MMFKKIFDKVYDEKFNRRCDDPGYNKYYTYKDFAGMKEEPFSFVNKRGDVLRGGLYYYGDGSDDYDCFVVFFHGMNAGYLAYMNEINMLAKAGFLVLSYDYAATFSSDGKDLEGFGRPLSDFEDALKAIKADFKLSGKTMLAMGHSWGGYTALNALNMTDAIKAAVCVSPPISYKAIIRQSFPGILGRMIEKPALEYERGIFGDLIYLSGLSTVKNDTPILFIYSKDDPTITYKYNYKPLEKVDDNPNHTRMVFTDKDHFPLMTRPAIKKLRARQAQVAHWLADGKTAEEIRALSKGVVWDEMVEQDEFVWKNVIDFLRANK